MTRRPHRAAIIVGAGLTGRWHAHALQRLGAAIAAVVDTQPDRARRLAERVGVSRTHTSLTEALDADPHAQTVHVCTPTPTHVEVARTAIAAGCHVLIEKPLAPTLRETEQVLADAEARGVHACPVHQFLFQPGFLRIAGALPRLGPVRHVDLVACSGGATSGMPPNEVAADILSHPLSVFGRLFPQRLAQVDWHVLHAGDGEIRVTGQLGGATAAALLSLSGRPTRNTLRVIATHGTVHCDLFHGFATIESGTVSRLRKIARPFSLSTGVVLSAGLNLMRRALRREPAYPGLRELIHRFQAAVSDGAPLPVTPQEALDIASARDIILARFASPGSA